MIRTERADARANRVRVLEAARETFARQGLAAEIKDIADLAGVGVGTIYRSFGSKTDLLSAVAEQAAEVIHSLFDAADAEPDPVAGLRGLLTAAVGFSDSYGWLFELFISGRFPSDAIPYAEHQAGPDLEDRLHQLIARGVSAGAYRADLPIDVVVVLIKGALMSLMSPLGRPGRPAISASDFADGVVRLLA